VHQLQAGRKTRRTLTPLSSPSFYATGHARLAMVATGVGLGALWGAAFGFAAHLATRGKRDFSSVQSFEFPGHRLRGVARAEAHPLRLALVHEAHAHLRDSLPRLDDIAACSARSGSSGNVIA
jgi:hypothetical protein